MKTTNIFIRLIFLLLLISGNSQFAKADVTLNCESGNRAIEQGNCWGFGATTYSNSNELVISGQWSAKSNSLTNNSPTSCWIKTPWMLVGSGNITLQSRLDGNGNGVSSKGIVIAYIPYVASAAYGEGTPVQFYTYNFPSFNTKTIRNLTVPIPPEIANSTEVYKFRVSFIGQGGNERAYSDNFVFPGTYWSDPSSSCGPLPVIQDADGDGVADANDSYPNDAYRAYKSFYPSSNSNGTLAFEDSWPNRSDYDMNDLVVDYQFTTVSNAANNIVEIHGKIIGRASGASFKNGLGFQLDGITPNKITSYTGNLVSAGSTLTFLDNGLESGQQYANCIAFDNFYKLLTHPGSGTGINTDPNSPVVPYDTLFLEIKFLNNGTAPAGGTVSTNQFNANSFNFYLFSLGHRDKEIHLPDRVPTSLANTALFGTGADDTNPAQGKYYKTSNNLPWAINVLQGFDYPSEKSAIDETYLHFIDWALSSGQNYTDWYLNLSGYRNNSLIY